MKTIKYSAINDPNSWDSFALPGNALPFKFLSNDDAKLAAEWLNPIMAERDTLRQQRDELLAALEIFVYRMDHNMGEPTEAEQVQARAAITRAKGQA